MVNNRFHKVDEMFEMVLWTPREEKVLVDLVIELKNEGRVLHVGSQADDFSVIAARLSTKLGKIFAIRKVVKKFNSLSTRYDLWEVVLNWPGVRMNGGEDKFVADASTWAAIIQVHPYAKKYVTKPEPLWVEMDIIFGQFKRNEDLRRSFEFLRGLSFLDAHPKNATTVPGDPAEDAKVNDAHSSVGGVHHTLPLSAPSAYDPSFGVGKILTGTSSVGCKMARFEDDYESTNSNFSSTGSCMGP